MKETILDIFGGALPTVVICSVIAITLRITYLFKHRVRCHIVHELLSLVFIIYIVCLFYVVTFQDIDGPWVMRFNFYPFREMFRYSFGSRLFLKNVLGNLLLFVPYGFFVSYVLKERRLSIVLLLTCILSCTIEFMQLQIGRVFDIDDILLNVMGGLFGYLIYWFLYQLGKLFTRKKEKTPDRKEE